GIARRTAQHAHFAEEAARGKIAEEDRLAADILLDHHRSRADDIDVVALLALGQYHLARGHAFDLGGVDDGTKVLHRQSALEDLEQLPFERDAVDRAFGAWHRCHQLERRRARHFDEDAVRTRADRRTALAARDQPDLAEDRSLFDRSEEHTSELQSRENLVC